MCMEHSLIDSSTGARATSHPQQCHAALRPGLVRELACAALRHQADAGGVDEAAGVPAGWLGDALLRPLLLCALKCARPAPWQATEAAQCPQSSPEAMSSMLGL